MYQPREKAGIVPYEFNPAITYPAYLIRNRLYRAIVDLSSQLHGRLLDFGCGLKPYQTLFKVDEYIGVDYAGEGETYSKSQVDILYDGKRLPFPDNHFDSIFSTEVFEHIFNLSEIMPELFRVLKPGGKILITCPFAIGEHEQPNDFARYTSFAIRHIFETNGFRVIEYRKTGNFIEAVVQLGIFYLDQHLIRKVRKIPVLRTVMRYSINITMNCFALLTGRIFRDNKVLFLNNVLLAEKPGA